MFATLQGWLRTMKNRRRRVEFKIPSRVTLRIRNQSRNSWHLILSFRELAMIGKVVTSTLYMGRNESTVITRVVLLMLTGIASCPFVVVITIQLCLTFWSNFEFLLSAGDVYNEEEHTKYCIICGSVFLVVLKRLRSELNHKFLLF